jgi:hypothetical protein
MKIPTGTSFASDHLLGVRAVWPSGPRGATAACATPQKCRLAQGGVWRSRRGALHAPRVCGMTDATGRDELRRLREKTARINAKEAEFASLLADQGLRAKTEALRQRSAEEQPEGQLRALRRRPSPTDE